MEDFPDFDGRAGEAPIKKGYIPGESRQPTADETSPPSGGSSVVPPTNQTQDDD